MPIDIMVISRSVTQTVAHILVMGFKSGVQAVAMLTSSRARRRAPHMAHTNRWPPHRTILAPPGKTCPSCWSCKAWGRRYAACISGEASRTGLRKYIDRISVVRTQHSM